MADSTDPPAAAATQDAVETKASVLPKPAKKGRITRPEKPSREVLTKEIADINTQIGEWQKRIQEIKDSIDNQRQGKHGFEKEIQDARLQISATIAQFKVVMEQKKALREQLGAADEARKRMRDEAKSLRDRLPFVKVEQIDEEIKKLEYRMAHTSLTLNEEKKAVQQIRELNKSKDFVKDYTERMDKITADEGSRSGLTAKLKEKDDQLNALKAKEQQQKADVDALWAKSRASVTDVPTLAEEREKLWAQVKEHREKINRLKYEFRQKEDEYWAKESEWRAQQADDRKKAYEEREAYRKEKEEKRKAWEAENFVEPYTDEIIICDQLTIFVQKLGAPAGEGGEEDQGQKKAVAAEGFGKMVVSKKNREDEEDSFFGGLAKGKKGKKQRQRERGEKFVAHSLDTLTSFGKIKVTPPTSTAECEETLAKIKEKKEEFVKLQAEARVKREAAKEKAEKDAVEAEAAKQSGAPSAKAAVTEEAKEGEAESKEEVKESAEESAEAESKGEGGDEEANPTAKESEDEAAESDAKKTEEVAAEDSAEA